MRLSSVLTLIVLITVTAAHSAPAANTPATGPAPSLAAPPGKTAVPPAPAAAAAPVGTHALERADLEAWLDGFMPYALQTGDIAGGVVAVVKDGDILFEKGYGYADVEAKRPVDPTTTMFRPGSVSKLLTWTAVMQLVGEGKLDLDKDVNEYLDFKLPSRADGPITLRTIMTHTAGFEEQIKSLISSDPKALIPLPEYAKNYTPIRIYKAGSTPAYSNYATALAGHIIERVSGQSFDDYIDQHVLQPLEMEHSTFRQPLPEKFAADMAKGYRLASGSPPARLSPTRS
ncbi:MAG: beta-lactamase family protein [Proteobacteria bacterium]|nr:beta-lactamase family protein [Pseudomonadota bacterium]